MIKNPFFKFVKKHLESPSGKFLIDNNGITLSFEPSEDNDFIIEETESGELYTYNTYKSIRTFVVPKGVTGFASEFMRGVRVTEKFEFPDGLLSIGDNSSDFEHGQHCVFADCILPSVVIPDSVKEIGEFAFGNSRIETLQIPAALCSPYGRQFKGSYIGTLRLPKEWKDIVSLDDQNRLDVKLERENYGYLCWPSTAVGKLMFY